MIWGFFLGLQQYIQWKKTFLNHQICSLPHHLVASLCTGDNTIVRYKNLITSMCTLNITCYVLDYRGACFLCSSLWNLQLAVGNSADWATEGDTIVFERLKKAALEHKSICLTACYHKSKYWYFWRSFAPKIHPPAAVVSSVTVLRVLNRQGFRL